MILYLNSDEGQFSLNKKDYLLRAAKRMGIEYVKDIKEADGEIQYVLNIQPCEIKQGSVWTGLWHIDVQLDSHFPTQYVNTKTVFVASRAGKIPFDSQKTIFFPQACDPELHQRTREPTVDFVICGTSGTDGEYGERGRIYKLLSEKFTYIDHGNGHPPQKYVDCISQGRVMVVQSAVTQGVEGRLQMCAQRFFACLAIGPMVCCDSVDFKYLGLTDKKDCFVYHNDRELVRYMRLLTKDKDLRGEIAENGRKKALLFHSYEHRLVSILNTIRETGFNPT